MITSVRGFRDILEPKSSLFSHIEKVAREIFSVNNYQEIRIPTVEYYELFVKSTGETTDIVEKEMYKFSDLSQRELALRPEGTPGVARAYINNNLNLNGKNGKFFYIANMFRAERPQAGRFREFEQIGAEYISTESPYSDAEMIIMLDDIFKELNIKDYLIEINSIGCAECRKKYKEKLIKYLKTKEGLCQSCLNRMDKNPLRTLDCKVDKDKFYDLPELELCDSCKFHNEKLKTILSNSKINFSENKRLVRGLDYYSRTVFEFKTNLLGAQDALAAGGRYDNLIKSMGGPNAPSIGWAMGVDRISMLIEKNSPLKEISPKIFVVCAEKDFADYSFSIVRFLREKKIRTDFSDFYLSLKSQLRSADKSNAEFAIIIGEEEFKNKKVSLKNLIDKTQNLITIDELINKIN